MTALDLGTASRVLTPPASAFSSIDFGDVTLPVVNGPKPVGEYLGIPSIPFVDGSSPYIYKSGTSFPLAQDMAVFIAMAVNGTGFSGEGWPFSHFNGVDISVTDTKFGTITLGNHNSPFGSNVDMPTPIGDAGLVVIAVLNNSVEGRVMTSLDGTVLVDANPQAASATGGFLIDPTGIDGHLFGVWLFEGAVVTAADAADTMAAIEAMLLASVPVSWSAAGTVSHSGAADFTVGDLPDDPTVTAPTAGGTRTPPADPTPAIPSVMQAAGVYPVRHVWETMPAPTLDANSQPVNWTPSASGNDEYGYLQIVIEGTDVTLFDGIETPFPSWRRAEPFGAQTATIELPQIHAFRAIPTWARHGANVSINLDVIGGSVVSLFQGFVMDVGIREDSGIFTLEAMGVLFGADLTVRPPSFTTAPKDIGNLIPSLLNGVTGRRYNSTAPVVTGIKSSIAGGWENLLTGYIPELLATALDSSGRQWTVKCANRTPSVALKDTTTVAATVRAGQRGIAIDLNSDASQCANVIYGEGIASDGGRWRNAKYPNWKPDDTPDYPFTNPATTIKVGTTDADTDSGDGVSVWQRKVGQPVTGTFSQSDRLALLRLQRAAGITVDGYLGPQSWAATFDTGANTGTLDGAFIAPLAYVSEVMPRLYGPDGDDLGANPDYDEDIVRVERKINYGQGVPKSQGVTSAKRTLARESEPGWFGLMSFELDPSGKSKYELREGENIRVLGWHGEDIDLHVASARYDETVVALEVDSKARDYPELQALMTRDRGAVDPAKVAVKRLLRGDTSTDRATYDAESPAGRMPKHAIFSGLWDVRRIPLGSFGSVVRTEFTTSGSAQPFSLAVFGKPVTAADLVSAVGNPMTATTNPWESDAVDDLGLLQAWGWAYQPAGYYPATYSNPDGNTAAPITGRLVDTATWDYASDQSPWVWVAAFASSACYIEGRFYGAPTD